CARSGTTVVGFDYW
nr:immunoglobulin heavy chain junction region [Mus musculus]MBK4188877.1 immunoglobulin heavy chain junction region [Mus musculus]